MWQHLQTNRPNHSIDYFDLRCFDSMTVSDQSFPSLATTQEPMLVMQGVCKSFGATRALSEVSFSVSPGEVVALIGENGAGKSTLMKLLSGAHLPDDGSMQLAGRPYRPMGPNDARRQGIAMIYQELNLAKDLSVEDNLMLGREKHRWGWVSRKEQRKKVVEILELIGHPDLSPTRLVGQLSIGAQQLVEIARALLSDAKVMIFDEPTSSLPKKDVDRLFAIIDRLRQQGIAIVYISHFLEEIRRIASRFVVLRDGQVVGGGPMESTSDPEIVTMMAGRSVENQFPKVPHSIGVPVLRTQRLTGRVPSDVSLELRKGEIFGLFGLVGAGRTETLRQIFGLDKTLFGTVELADERLRSTPRHCLRAGLGLVSEDRKTEGLAQNLSIADNLTLSDLSPVSRFGVLHLSKRTRVVREWMQRMSVKARSSEQTIGELSGGNQQKVAIARVLHQNAEVLLLDEPTRGIDVRTKADIYQWIGELAATGKSILFVSSYLPELVAVCDTIGVMAKGRLREVRAADAWTEQDILSVAVSNE
jgi:ribose transport system ATP-binding protein